LPNLYVDTFAVIGSWHNRPTSWANKYSDFQDNVSYLVGKHALKFGGEFAHILVNSVAHDNVRGRIDFNHLQDFFAGNPKNGRYFVGNAARTMTWNSSAAFFQDDWRVSPKLTVNLGLRYSYVSPMKEVHNLFGNFDPTTIATTGGAGSAGTTRDQFPLEARSQRLLATRGFCLGCLGQGHDCGSGRVQRHSLDVYGGLFPGARRAPGHHRNHHRR